MEYSNNERLTLKTLLALDGTGNSRRQAWDIGLLDATPIPQTFADSVGAEDLKDFYRFSLLSASNFNLNLDELSANANVFLQDEAGNIIASSINRSSTSESIEAILAPGIYYVLVRSADRVNTNYELTLSAQFIVDEEIVSDSSVSIIDPEFDGRGYLVTWQDARGNLWVAPVNPETGDFILEEAILIDSGLPSVGITKNGPDWVYTEDGAQIIYTKLVDKDFFLSRARWTGSSWQAEILPDSKGAYAPLGTLNPEDPTPLIRYFVGTPSEPKQALAWRELDNPSIGGIFPGTSGDSQSRGGRWVEGEDSLIYSFPVEGIFQVFQYNVETDNLTQLTFSPSQKSSTFMWKAPEFNGELIFFAVETEDSESNQIGVYRQINGAWTKFKTIPTPSLQQITSPEYFIYNNKSYISFLTIDSTRQFSEVWIAGIETNLEFYRQVSDPNIEILRKDTESLIVETGAFIYYPGRVNGQRVIYRADTGLGLPTEVDNNNIEPDSQTALFVDIPSTPHTFSELVDIGDRIHYQRQQESNFVLPPDGAGNNLNKAREIGLLDATPLARIFSDFVGQDDRKDYYRFELQADSFVQLILTGLTDNANLFLGDDRGNLIVSSLGRGSTSESISQTLNPGTYYVLVLSSAKDGNPDTNYDLSLKAQFITDEEVVSNPDVPLPDPEFDRVGFRITWQDVRGNLWVAPVNPQTGDFLLEEANQIDSGLAPISMTKNGPEWAYSQDGAQILYTKLIDGDFLIGRARWTGSSWEAEILPDSQGGNAPVGTLNPEEENPLIRYFVGTPSQPRQSIVWRELNNPNVGGLLPGTSAGQSKASRWVEGEGERALTYTLPIDGINQVFKYDVDTDTLTQLTFDSIQKSAPFMWKAPEFNDELVFLVLENIGSGAKKIGLYRFTDGNWQKFKQIDLPSQLNDLIALEPFVYNGKSYISFTAREAFGDPSEIWIAGIEPDFDFYRQVSNPQVQIPRTDTESLITEEGAFIYYIAENLDGQRVIYRADTGLGLPQILGNSLKESREQSLLDLVSTSTILRMDRSDNTPIQAVKLGWLDATPIGQTLADSVGTDDRRDYYRFELQAESNLALTLDSLGANANLYLLDSARNTIASSQNKGKRSESIATTLNSGTYYVLVKSGGQNSTDYDLTLQAQFLTNVVELDLSGRRVPDPEFVGEEWQVELLPPGINGGAPNGSKTKNDFNTLINYFFKDEAGDRVLAWRELNNLNKGGEVPFTFKSGARWVEGERFFVSTAETTNVNQVVAFNVDTETLTQLTFDSELVKDKPQMWHAPEFNNNLVFFALESDPATPNRPDRLGIYRKIDGSWTRIKTIDPPSQLPLIDSPEHFVYNNKSYIVMATVSEQGGSEIWLAGIDPDKDFYRQVSDPELPNASTDPEPFITDAGAFIYYAQQGGGRLFRADTGLGSSLAVSSNDPLTMPSFSVLSASKGNDEAIQTKISDPLNLSNFYDQNKNFNSNLDPFYFYDSNGLAIDNTG